MLAGLEDNFKLVDTIVSTEYLNINDEKISKMISQSYIELLIDGTNADNHFCQMGLKSLPNYQSTFGQHNGGCLLYDFVPRNEIDIAVLSNHAPINKMIINNKIQALEASDPLLRDVFPINFSDVAFSQAFFEKLNFSAEECIDVLSQNNVSDATIESIISSTEFQNEK